MLLGSFENNALERAGKGQSVTRLEWKIMGLKRKLNLKNYQLYIYFMITRISSSVMEFRLADFFSEKNYCGSPWSPRSAIFGPDDLHPMY